MKKIITICILFFAWVSQGQSFEWFETPPIDFTGNGSLISYPNTIDPFDHIYVAGYQDNRFLYGDIFGNLLLNKYTATGNLIFSKTIEGHVQVYNIKSDALGNLLMLAGYVQNIKIGAWEMNTTNQGIQPLLLKFDSDGNLMWQLPLNTIDIFIQHAEAMVIDPISNNCYVAFDNYVDVYIQKISTDGTILNTITQTDTSRITSLSLDTEQNIYAAGSCASAGATYAGVSVPADFSYNTYVVKYNSNGLYQWVKYVEDITCSTPIVVAGSPNEIYFCSYLFGAYTFGDFTADGPESIAFGDFFLTKLDANGNFQWVREVPGDGFGEFNLGNRNALAIDNTGKIYIGGSTSRTINWGNSIVSNIPGNSGDAAILKYDADGTIQQVITGGGISEDRVDGISVDSNGAVYASGLGFGNTSFGSFDHNETNYFPYLTKINSTLKINTNSKEKPLCYPNPAKDLLYFHNVEGNGSIYNMLGQVVMKFKASMEAPISLRNLSSGTYMVVLDGFKAHKLIKE